MVQTELSKIAVEIPYNGLFNGLDKLVLRFCLGKSGSTIKGVVVMPSQESEIQQIPSKINPEIYDFIWKTWGYTGDVKIVNPYMN
ncbi:hypothetical protein HYY70_03655 [Candidatus Woesearchaeota archaeon]|nr:hypothetical protein [Candidatus Woesearchaeota archaeon]